MPVEQLTSRVFEHGAEVVLRQRGCGAPVRGDPAVEALARRLAACCGLDAKPPIDAGDATRLDAVGDRDLIVLAVRNGNLRGAGVLSW